MKHAAHECVLASCACGTVRYEARGEPIASVACYCSSCRKAGAQLEALPGASPVLRPDQGTDFCLFRKDRVVCMAGADQLQDYRLAPGSPTRRIVASCCNTMMALDFSKGHWLSMHRDRFPETMPDVQFGIMTKGTPRPRLGDRTAYPGFPFALLGRLISAQLAMIFERKSAREPAGA